MAYALVALDTDHIKGYVFGTDRLKEIRGASSILDRLNRVDMRDLARRCDPEAHVIYANGGSGLFLLAEEHAEEFVRSIRERYRQQSAGGASLTGAIQPLPAGLTVQEIWQADLHEQLELLRYKLRRAKDLPPSLLALPSHPLLQLCASCGSQDAVDQDRFASDPGEDEERYCSVCLKKRAEDVAIKQTIDGLINKQISGDGKSDPEANDSLWPNLIRCLPPDYFKIGDRSVVPGRPRDIDAFRSIASAREYIGLVYADGNGMGKTVESLGTLRDLQNFAEQIDRTIYKALAAAVQKYLPPVHLEGGEEREDQGRDLFPFDVLLLGGDDLLLLTTADRAMDVALEVARVFKEKARFSIAGQGREYQGSLSVGVVLAPMKYPFGLLLDLVESTLRFAKRHGSDEQRAGDREDDSRINFMVVAGGSSRQFDYLYEQLYWKRTATAEFRATLRPYRLAELESLLRAIRQARKQGFPRSKLHQLREAILKMNLTSAVTEALVALQGARKETRNYLLTWTYAFDQRYRERAQSIESADLFPGFPRIVFPWSRMQERGPAGHEVYQTPLLDLIELYDFISPEEGGDENAD